jgi:nucleoside-diphosphate-sugar epimerase
VKCLVTGAGGFIGDHLVRYLLDAGHEVRAVGASEPMRGITSERLENVQVARSAVDPATWQVACRDMEVIFHLAGRAHRADSVSPSARSVYFRDNLEMTRALAEAAMKARVRRFVFASSVAVYGTASVAGEAFREDSPVALHPDNVYAHSKRAVEEFLLSDCAALEPVVVRLPLVYGAGVKGNMATLIRLVTRGFPLPLAKIDNRRSFINIPNCVDFLLSAACCPNARERILLASDREDVATPDLILMISRELEKPARLFSVSPKLLRTACFLVGKKTHFEKLAGDFRIDPADSCDLLGWSPKVSLAEGVAQMCAGIRCQESGIENQISKKS